MESDAVEYTGDEYAGGGVEGVCVGVGGGAEFGR